MCAGGCVGAADYYLKQILNQAVRMQAPPTSLILFSAVFENSLAFTITGTLGRAPLPNTLKNPALVTSITVA